MNNHVPQVYVRDMQTGTTRMVSVNRLGKSADPFAEHGDISADGRYVIFASDDKDMTTGDANAKRDIFRRTLATGATVRVSRRIAGGTELQANDFGSISGNGRYVVFESDSKLIPTDANNQRDIYRRDLVTGKLEVVSLKADDAQINGGSIRPTISAEGSRIVFSNDANGIAGNDDNNVSDVFVRNTLSGHTLRVSVRANGDNAGDAAHWPRTSRISHAVAFSSSTWARRSPAATRTRRPTATSSRSGAPPRAPRRP